MGRSTPPSCQPRLPHNLLKQANKTELGLDLALKGFTCYQVHWARIPPCRTSGTYNGRGPLQLSPGLAPFIQPYAASQVIKTLSGYQIHPEPLARRGIFLVPARNVRGTVNLFHIFWACFDHAHHCTYRVMFYREQLQT
jgi:hypothetical protein